MIKILLLVMSIQGATITRMPLPSRALRDTTNNIIVIHNDGANMNARQTHAVLSRRKLSYHYFIDRDGRIYEFVNPKFIAKHAGVSVYDGMYNWNTFSIGVCLQGRSGIEYTAAQYRGLQTLISHLQTRYILNTKLYTHEQIAFPWGRKNDPGILFNASNIRIDTIQSK
jgi:AmpD protein